MGCRCPQLNSCLCCSLHAGVLAIGITCLVLNTLGALFMAAILASPDLIRQTIMEDPSLFEGDESIEVQVERITLAVNVLVGLGLASMLVCIVLDVALLIGRCRSWPCPLLAWVIGYSVVTAGTIGFGLYLAVIMVATADTDTDLLAFVLTQLAAGGVYVYLIMVVHSYHRVLKERQHGGAYNMRPMIAA